jgi:uncharacterized membrane protein
MDANLHLWLEYLLRFSHLVAGIAWIGSSFYFIWLDSSFEAPATPRRNVDGELFMVHGGFYYQVEKRKIYPGELPKVLHWFKWEATLTWVTGILLFVVLYYLRGASLLIDQSVRVLTQGQAIGISLAIVIAAWLIYDLLFLPRFAKFKSISTFLALLFLAGLIYGLTKTFSGRGAFILTGAIMGTMMLANVWMRILPGQRKMIRDAEAGKVPDYSLSLKSKTRSVHNTYFIFPVLFIMLSNHYPTLYNHELNWLLLILLTVSGAMTRHAMVTKNPIERWILAPAALALIALVYLSGVAPKVIAATSRIEYQSVHSVMQSRCLSCHSANPTDEVWRVPPNGMILETEAQLREKADKVYLHVVLAKSMPLANKTNMTEEERNLIAQWFKQEGLGTL